MTDAAGFLKQLKPASFRGVPFGVLSSRKVFGRRLAVHEYPNRDTVWIEDLGRKSRAISFTGFLVSDSAVYGGGDVLDQQQALIAAIETDGPGKLVHPTLGELNVSAGDCSIDESFEALGYLAIDLVFTEAGEKTFPSQTTNTTDKTNAACTDADKAASSDFVATATSMLSSGATTAVSALATITDLANKAISFGQDAGNLFGLASQLSGDFGRFFNGRNLGGLLGAISPLLDASTTIGDLIGLAITAQSAIGSAAASAETIAGNLGQGASSNSPADLAGAVQILTSTVQLSAADPASAVRLMVALQAYEPATMAAYTPIGQAIGDVVRRSAVVALARASTTYQPWSYDDAATLRSVVAEAIDAEITVAGDQGADATFNALRTLRVAVVQDLTARGANLAPIVDVVSAMALPDVVLANRLYRDAGRAPELLTEANPVHPLFMPQSFRALAS